MHDREDSEAKIAHVMLESYMQDEGLRREEINEIQLKRLKETVAQAAKTEWYQEKLCALDIGPDDITSLEDIRKLPLTSKDDLRAGMPYKFLAVPKREVVRMHYSSGTTGIATAVYHTRNDLQYWTECVARGLRAAGVDESDVFQNMMTYGLFTGGLGLHYGAEIIGCMTIPAGSGNTKRQVYLMQQFGVTALHILPSYTMRIYNYCQEHGIDPIADLNVKYVFVGGEPYTKHMRNRIEEAFDCKVFNCYGLSEMCGPGVAMECKEQNGLHMREDHYLMEILDPNTLEPVALGQQGELVLTTLRREAMPLLRYRTRDITCLLTGQCPCGSHHSRIDRILGRTDDMLIVKGVNIYPQQVEHVLMDIPQVGTNYLIVLDSSADLDEMTVKVELSQDMAIDQMRELTKIEETLIRNLREELMLTPKVELLQPSSLPDGEGKAVRVVDNRKSR